MNRVLVTDLHARSTMRGKRIKKIILFCMRRLKLDQHEVHISMISDLDMRMLNQTYRDKDKTTDVLSFEQGELIDGYMFLGDVLISPTQARAQAHHQKHRVKDEFAVLSIHGLLHLLGYDHMQEQDEKIMFGIQNELFARTINF